MVSFRIAMTADSMTKNTINKRITVTDFLSETSFLLFLVMMGISTSSASVEDEVSAKDERVDMEADSTNTMTNAIMMAGNEDNMEGMMRSCKTTPASL